MKYICKICEYDTNHKSNFNRHLKTKKHMNMAKLNCMCGKKYKTKNGLWKHKKNCGYNMQLKIMELEKTIFVLQFSIIVQILLITFTQEAAVSLQAIFLLMETTV